MKMPTIVPNQWGYARASTENALRSLRGDTGGDQGPHMFDGEVSSGQGQDACGDEFGGRGEIDLEEEREGKGRSDDCVAVRHGLVLLYKGGRVVFLLSVWAMGKALPLQAENLVRWKFEDQKLRRKRGGG